MLDGIEIHPELKTIGINFVSNLLWFLAGLLSVVLMSHSRKWFRPRFWSDMLRSRVVLVVGAHDSFGEYESSGMIGTGDALALAEFIAFFKKSKFENYEVVSTSTIGPASLAHNLILIGGPGANQYSRDFIQRTSGKRQIRFGDPERLEIWFELKGEFYTPTTGVTRTDAAAIVFDDSPYSTDKFVILVSGSFGHGTLAAAQFLCRGGSFARRARWLRRFEAVVRCDVIGNGPTSIELERLV